MTPERPFIAFAGESGPAYLNLSQIRMVTLKPDRVEIHFSETHVVNLQGEGALEFCNRLADAGVALNGDPLTRIDIQRLVSGVDQSPKA